MPGGASLRRFFRVRYADGHSAVGMYFPPAARAEEATSQPAHGAACAPFLEVRELLEQRAVRVPRLLGTDLHHGWLLVEDLTDQTLAAALLDAPQHKEALYQLAVRDLARAQQSLEHLPADSITRTRAFDTELLLWEIDHFREWGLEARGITLTTEQQQRFAAAAKGLAEQVRALDYGFVHRDYQSRNLMALGDTKQPAPAWELSWIDFQDALQGPRVYDLVALLNDSYQSFDSEFVTQRLREYVAHRGLPASEFDAIEREFHLVTIQRKLKDAGRFVYIERVKGDASYLRFIEPSLHKIRHAMAQLPNEPHVQALSQLLNELLPAT